jgi:hypothetical protein
MNQSDFEEARLMPVILSDAIFNQARLWGDGSLGRWDEAGRFPRICEETLTSPVDLSPRKVVLHLSYQLFEGGRPAPPPDARAGRP